MPSVSITVSALKGWVNLDTTSKEAKDFNECQNLARRATNNSQYGEVLDKFNSILMTSTLSKQLYPLVNSAQKEELSVALQ